jgi:hypothetical protein
VVWLKSVLGLSCCQNSGDPTAATGAQSATKKENKKLRIPYLQTMFAQS